eukprot:Tbor_TRINITY_DN5696_c3_g5::TRINITY_DN5696_c3_g5_i1::g.9188::m.9188
MFENRLPMCKDQMFTGLRPTRQGVSKRAVLEAMAAYSSRGGGKKIELIGRTIVSALLPSVFLESGNIPQSMIKVVDAIRTLSALGDGGKSVLTDKTNTTIEFRFEIPNEIVSDSSQLMSGTWIEPSEEASKLWPPIDALEAFRESPLFDRSKERDQQKFIGLNIYLLNQTERNKIDAGTNNDAMIHLPVVPTDAIIPQLMMPFSQDMDEQREYDILVSLRPPFTIYPSIPVYLSLGTIHDQKEYNVSECLAAVEASGIFSHLNYSVKNGESILHPDTFIPCQKKQTVSRLDNGGKVGENGVHQGIENQQVTLTIELQDHFVAHSLKAVHDLKFIGNFLSSKNILTPESRILPFNIVSDHADATQKKASNVPDIGGGGYANTMAEIYLKFTSTELSRNDQTVLVGENFTIEFGLSAFSDCSSLTPLTFVLPSKEDITKCYSSDQEEQHCWVSETHASRQEKEDFIGEILGGKSTTNDRRENSEKKYFVNSSLWPLNIVSISRKYSVLFSNDSAPFRYVTIDNTCELLSNYTDEYYVNVSNTINAFAPDTVLGYVTYRNMRRSSGSHREDRGKRTRMGADARSLLHS